MLGRIRTYAECGISAHPPEHSDRIFDAEVAGFDGFAAFERPRQATFATLACLVGFARTQNVGFLPIRRSTPIGYLTLKLRDSMGLQHLSGLGKRISPRLHAWSDSHVRRMWDFCPSAGALRSDI